MVYPRGCGGTFCGDSEVTRYLGLSPRVRGNRAGEGGGPDRQGSIPAGAGEPLAKPYPSVCHRVYPRGCGGTAVHETHRTKAKGLSPRVRGNHDPLWDGQLKRGSIPAGAGEPVLFIDDGQVAMVYPRGCGGTAGSVTDALQGDGLSPRVRGNRARPPLGTLWRRSIPAGAGEPHVCLPASTTSVVYPRGCGGTPHWTGAGNISQGLSPRVRGNPPGRHPG